MAPKDTSSPGNHCKMFPEGWPGSGDTGEGLVPSSTPVWSQIPNVQLGRGGGRRKIASVGTEWTKADVGLSSSTPRHPPQQPWLRQRNPNATHSPRIPKASLQLQANLSPGENHRVFPKCPRSYRTS